VIQSVSRRCPPWAEIARFVGEKELSITADTYTHVMADETELDFRALSADR
jgi:hypothetical protein